MTYSTQSKALKLLLKLSLISSLALAPLAFAAPEIPAAPADGYVFDQANLLSPETEALLEQKLFTLEQETSIEIAVVTVPELQGYDIAVFSVELFRKWGIGQTEFENGLLFLTAADERKFWITTGYGLEGAVTDLESSIVYRQIVLPYFKDDLYDEGTIAGVTALEQLSREEEFDLTELEREGSDKGLILSLTYALLPFIWLFFSMLSGTKSWWLGGVFGGLIGLIASQTFPGLLIGGGIGLFIDFILSTILFKKIKWTGGSGSFYGGGRSGRGGGFGGFGGGSTGGGGAGGGF